MFAEKLLRVDGAPCAPICVRPVTGNNEALLQIMRVDIMMGITSFKAFSCLQLF